MPLHGRRPTAMITNNDHDVTIIGGGLGMLSTPVLELLTARFFGFSPLRDNKFHRLSPNLLHRRKPKIPYATPNFT